MHFNLFKYSDNKKGQKKIIIIIIIMQIIAYVLHMYQHEQKYYICTVIPWCSQWKLLKCKHEAALRALCSLQSQIIPNVPFFTILLCPVNEKKQHMTWPSTICGSGQCVLVNSFHPIPQNRLRSHGPLATLRIPAARIY